MRDAQLEAAGIPSSAVHRLIDSLEQQGLDPHALTIARHGTIVFECAWRPYAVSQPALVYSVTKTFTSLAIGLLESEGAVSLDDSVGALLDLPNPHGITVRHLLTMNTGHDARQIEDLRFDVRALLTTRPAATPGTRFAYNSDATYALSCIVTALTGQRLTDYLRDRVLDPIGIGRRWMKPTRGVEQGFSGFHLTVTDLARVSMMLGAGGRVGEEQIVPGAYVNDLQQPWSDTRDPDRADTPADPEAPVDDWALGYGFQVWRNSRGFRLDGAYGQFGVVLPERGLVIAYQGSTVETPRTLRAFWALVDAITDEPAEVDPSAVEALRERAAALDTWDARALMTGAQLEGVPVGEVDAGAWQVDETPGGWIVTMPDGQAIEVRADTWTRTMLRLFAPSDAGDPVVASPPVEDGTHVPVAARGAIEANGTVIHLVVPTSPHRLLVHRDADGVVSAAWHTVPLQGPTLAALAVPEWVCEPVD